MHKKYIIYYPFGGTNAYIENMKRCLGKLYKVIPLSSAEDNISVLMDTKAIVLNWVESGFLDNEKRKLLLYKLLGIKIIWVFHNLIPHMYAGDEFKIQKSRRDMKFLAGISNAIILHSEHSRIYAEAYTDRQDKIFFVPHVDYMKQYRWAYSSCLEDNPDFIFVFQGAIAPYKNIELLIRVFKDLNMQHCQLHITGKPYSETYAQQIRELAADARIQLRFEYLSDYDVGKEIRRGDIMVLPYDIRSSLNSGAMLTAFTNRRTVIVSNNAMAQDYCGEDFLYIYHYSDQGDHYCKLKAVMKQAYLNGKLVNKKKGENAYQYTRMHNNDDVVVQRLKEIWKKI